MFTEMKDGIRIHKKICADLPLTIFNSVILVVVIADFYGNPQESPDFSDENFELLQGGSKMRLVRGSLLTSTLCTVLSLSCSQYDQFKGSSVEKDKQGTGDVTPSADGEGVIASTPAAADTSTDETGAPSGKNPKAFLAQTDEEALKGLKSGEEQIAIVCNRNTGKTNKVLTAFCVNKIRPKSLIEFQTALGIAVVNPALTARNQNGTGGNPAFAFTGHSSSLVGRFSSSINPRAIIMSTEVLSNNNPNPNFVVMGFVRGEQFAEIAVNNPSTPGQIDFFLAGFKQACNSAPGGCLPADLLTPAVESNWTEFTLFQDEDLKNSIVDCRHCHQPEGPTGPKILRMSELRNPWTHFFRDNTAGINLINDYYAAHTTAETYAGIPGPMINGSDPQKLENLVTGNGFVQLQAVGQFQTNTIQNEVQASSPNQPVDNTVPGKSATWDAFFQKVVQGLTIPVPYHDVKVTEPSLLAQFTKQYVDFKAGMVAAKDFLDHREVLRPDQKQRADMGFAVAPGTTPQDTLMLACSQCHNSKLDQTLSRAKFNVNLKAMPNAVEEIDVAILRLKLGLSEERLKNEDIKIMNEKGEPISMHKAEHVNSMPPRRFKQLTDEQIDGLIKFLQDEKAKLAL